MVRRPWPIVILAAIHIIAPLLNALFAAQLLDMSIDRYFTRIFATSPTWKLAAQFGLLPLAGVAIYLTKKWSYYIFVAIMCAVVYLTFKEHQAHPYTLGLALTIGIMVLNLGVVSYFLLPRVSRVYHNKTLRWWEQKPRFNTNVPALIHIIDKQVDCIIENISETGAKIDIGNHQWSEDDPAIMEITGAPTPFSVQIEPVQSFSGKWGIRFIHTTDSRTHVRKYIDALIENGARPRTPIPPWTESLMEWLKTFFKTGKGLLPGE